MKRKMIYATLALLAVVILVSDIVYLRNRDRERKERILDQQELHYDADGPLILIETSNGLMGIYEGRDSLRHVWNEKLKMHQSGLYELRIYPKEVVLYSAETGKERVLILRTAEKEYLSARMHTGVPVLVFTW